MISAGIEVNTLEFAQYEKGPFFLVTLFRVGFFIRSLPYGS